MLSGLYYYSDVAAVRPSQWTEQGNLCKYKIHIHKTTYCRLVSFIYTFTSLHISLQIYAIISRPPTPTTTSFLCFSFLINVPSFSDSKRPGSHYPLWIYILTHYAVFRLPGLPHCPGGLLYADPGYQGGEGRQVHHLLCVWKKKVLFFFFFLIKSHLDKL